MGGDGQAGWRRPPGVGIRPHGGRGSDTLETGGEVREGMTEPLDERLRDDAALDEIELTSRLMIAATSKDAHLTQDEVDEILGITQD